MVCHVKGKAAPEKATLTELRQIGNGFARAGVVWPALLARARSGTETDTATSTQADG